MNWASELVIDLDATAKHMAKALSTAATPTAEIAPPSDASQLSSGIAIKSRSKEKNILCSDRSLSKRPTEGASQKSPKKNKNSKLSKSISTVNRGKEKVGEVRLCPHDKLMVELPKGFTHLGKEESLSFVKAIETSDDDLTFFEHTPEQIEYGAASHLVKFLAYYSRLSNIMSPSSTKELQDSLATQELEKIKTAENISKLSVLNENLKREKQELRDEINQTKKALKSSEQQRLAQESRLKELEIKNKTIFDEGLVEGIKLCRQRLLRTVSGQLFLRELQEGLIEAYHSSSLYLKNMVPHISHFVGHGFTIAMKQAQEKGFAGEFSPQLAVKDLKASPAFKGDETQDAEHPWWLPVMHRAALHISSREFEDPELSPAEEIWYDINTEEDSILSNDQNPVSTTDLLSETNAQAPKGIHDEDTS